MKFHGLSTVFSDIKLEEEINIKQPIHEGPFLRRVSGSPEYFEEAKLLYSDISNSYENSAFWHVGS